MKTIGVAWCRLNGAVVIKMSKKELGATPMPASRYLTTSMPFVLVRTVDDADLCKCSKPGPDGDHRLNTEDIPTGELVRLYERVSFKQMWFHIKRSVNDDIRPPFGAPVHAE